MLGAPLPVHHIQVPFAPCSHATVFLRPATRQRRQLRCSWKGVICRCLLFRQFLLQEVKSQLRTCRAFRQCHHLCKTRVRPAVLTFPRSFDAGSWQSPCETSGSAPDSSSPPAGLPRSSFGDDNVPSVVVCSSDEETELLAPLKEEQFDPRFSR